MAIELKVTVDAPKMTAAQRSAAIKSAWRVGEAIGGVAGREYREYHESKVRDRHFSALVPGGLNAADLENWVADQCDEWGFWAPNDWIEEVATGLARDADLKDGWAMASRLCVYDADLSQARPSRWVWSDRYLIGYLNLICGQEKIGKSTLAAWTLARLSRGELDGDYLREPVNVAIIGDEDSWKDMWTPRLYAAGADMQRVKQIAAKDEGWLEISDDRADIEDVVLEHDFRVLYIDSLDDVIGRGQTNWNPKQVREALRPARQLARRLNIAVIGSKHTKKSGDSFREVMSDSHQFGAASRSSLLLAKHPDGAKGHRILAHGAGNLSDAESLEFVIRNEDVTVQNETWGIGVCDEFEASELSVDDIIGAKPPSTPKKLQKVDQARQHLEKSMDVGKQYPAGAMTAELVDMDLGAANTLTRAKELANVVSFQDSAGHWWRREPPVTLSTHSS